MGSRSVEGNCCLIDKREILEAASSFGLSPHVVEKDYVLGWLLAGIHAHEEIGEAWAFKGGTCLKKCYFETYRFSEDLDFTLRDESHIDEGFLKRALAEVVEWVAEQSGLTVPAEQIGIDIYTNPRGYLSCQGKIGYRGPVSTTSGGWPKIKLDLTADETLVLPAVRREVFHPYSDRIEEGFWANCYAYEEAFAEKLRALGERTRPRDLYDVVNLYRHADARPSASVLLGVLTKKCAFKSVALPSIEALLPHRQDLERMWQDMLAHQLPSLPPWIAFWEALPEIFNWIFGGAEALSAPPVHIAYETGETLVRSRVLPAEVLPQFRTSLEKIRFAAANRLCVDLSYGGSVRRIEPYSLRRTEAGNFVLHAVRRDSGESRSYRVDRMQGARVTDQSFTPRYLVELTATGPLTVVAAGTSPRLVQPSRPWTLKPNRSSTTSSAGPTYVYRCTVCRKTFERKAMDGRLNPHKHPQGYRCPGTVGVYVRTKF